MLIEVDIPIEVNCDYCLKKFVIDDYDATKYCTKCASDQIIFIDEFMLALKKCCEDTTEWEIGRYEEYDKGSPDKTFLAGVTVGYDSCLTTLIMALNLCDNQCNKMLKMTDNIPVHVTRFYTMK